MKPRTCDKLRRIRVNSLHLDSFLAFSFPSLSYSILFMIKKHLILFIFILLFHFLTAKVSAILPADANGDCMVDGPDYVIWLNHYNQSTSNGMFSGDFDNSGFVDGQDYVLWLNAYGSTEPGNATSTPNINPSPTSSPVTPPAGEGLGIWISPNEIAKLPASGSAWSNLQSDADSSFGSPNLADQDTRHNIRTMAAALVYARMGQESYRSKAANAIKSAMGTETAARSLAIGRNLAAYVIAADLIDLKIYRPSDDAQFRSWLSSMRTRDFDGRTLISCHEDRPNNWGTMCGASRIAADLYLNDNADLQKAVQVFQGYLGNRSSYAGFKFATDAFSFMCDTSSPRPINPPGCIKDGHDLSGAPVDDIQRAGPYKWLPGFTDYAWGGFSAAIAQAEMLHRAGYDSYNWENQAVLRGIRFLNEVVNFSQSNATTWTTWVVNRAYNTNYSTSSTSISNRLISYTDWTHQ